MLNNSGFSNKLKYLYTILLLFLLLNYTIISTCYAPPPGASTAQIRAYFEIIFISSTHFDINNSLWDSE